MDEKQEGKIVSLAEHGIGKLRALASFVKTRAEMAAKLGMQFGGARDLYKTLGYKTNPTYQDFLARYLRDDLAARILDAPVEASWAGEIKIEDEHRSTADSEFEKPIKKMAKRLNLFSYFQRANLLAGIGQYSVIFIGTRGNEDIALPLRFLRSSDDVIYLRVFSQDHAKIKSYNDDTSDPDYGMPKHYDLTIGSVQDGLFKKTRTKTVHASRVIHVAEGLGDVYGTPRLERIYNRLDDLAKIVGGSAETYWLMGNRGLQAVIDKEMELDPEDATKLDESIEDYQHRLRRFIKTRGVELKSVGSEVADPTGAFDVVISVIAGAVGIPKRVLLGSEQSQLASAQDRANFAARIAGRQKTFCEPNIVRPFVDRLIQRGALPTPINNEYTVDWPPALVLNEKEKAERASSIASATDSLNREVITIGEFRERYLCLPHDLPKERQS